MRRSTTLGNLLLAKIGSQVFFFTLRGQNDKRNNFPIVVETKYD